MSDETARHYAENLIRSGYGKVPTMKKESSIHECEPWEMLEKGDGGYYCGACGKDKAGPVKSAAEVWNEAIEAARKELAEATQYGGPHGQSQRKVSGWTTAAQRVATIRNPYTDTGIPARESEEWKALVVSAENLGRAVAEFQNAKDDYTTLYPKDSSAHQ